VKPAALLARLVDGQINNVAFKDLVSLVLSLGFELDRTRGSHQIYVHSVVRCRLNLQPDGGQAKPYQLRQLLALIEEWGLRLEDVQND
jgi:hypothetical protein